MTIMGNLSWGSFALSLGIFLYFVWGDFNSIPKKTLFANSV